MKRLFLRLFMLISIPWLLLACAKSPQSHRASGDVQVKIPVLNSQRSYSLQVVQLLGLDSLYQLGGKFARFFMAPGVNGNRLAGNLPKTHFLKSGDVYIAQDSLSLQLATVYAHTQKFAQWDHDLGYGEVNQWPRDIGVAVRLTNNARNNAFYDGDTDSMLFVPFTGNELPLAVNAGVLAHEHFHSLFYKIVTTPLNKAGKNPHNFAATTHSKAKFYKKLNIVMDGEENIDLKVVAEKDLVHAAYHVLVMRGLNEGLADYWGWAYTQDPDFLAVSLPSEKHQRSLNSNERIKKILSNSRMLKSRVHMLSLSPKSLMGNLNAQAYALGTQYARILKSLADLALEDGKNKEQVQMSLAKAILRSLEGFKKEYLQLAPTSYYQPVQFLLSLAGDMEVVTQKQCELIVEVIEFNNDSKQSFQCAEAGAKGWALTPREKKSEVVDPSKLTIHESDIR